MTPTERVEQEAAKTDFIPPMVRKKFALTLAQELERVEMELETKNARIEQLELKDKHFYEQLRSENAELRKDNERLDWLEQRLNWHWFTDELFELRNDKYQLRTAIDAAIAQQKGNP